MEEDILQKLDKLKQQFFGEDSASLEDIQRWEATVKRAVRQHEAQKNPAIQMVIKQSRAQLQEADALLSNDPTLTEAQRNTIFERKKAWKWFLNLFEVPEAAIKGIKKAVDEELEQ
jgi:hypothetical protein